jgi:hypothetical protein
MQGSYAATDGYSVKVEGEPMYFNGLSEFALVDGCSHTEIIDDLRWKALPTEPPVDQSSYVFAKLVFTSLPPFINESGGRLAFQYVPVSGGWRTDTPTGTYYGATMHTYAVMDHHGEVFEQYKIPSPYGLSLEDSTNKGVDIGQLGTAYQVREQNLTDIKLGVNYIGFYVRSYNGWQGGFETTIQLRNVLWNNYGTSQLLMVSKINRMDITTMDVYNVCFD